MIVLAALAAGREVIVSRGELVEIGGGFRVPDVMAQSGASLREVGTTNKTRAADYARRDRRPDRADPARPPVEFSHRGVHRAAGARGTRRAWQKIQHPRRRRSRKRLSRRSPGAVGPRLGDGVEPAVQTTVAAGVDVCCFSGDKLLGGPQAGIIVGRTAAVDRIRTAPADAGAAGRQDDATPRSRRRWRSTRPAARTRPFPCGAC